MAHKTRTMISLNPETLEAAKAKCAAKGYKLSSVIEVLLRGFLKKEKA